MNGRRPLLRRVSPGDVASIRRAPFDARTLAQARLVVERVRKGGEDKLRRIARRFGELCAGEPLVAGRDGMRRALRSLPGETRGLLERAAARIRRFARAQRRRLRDMRLPVPGGAAGHRFLPVARAGCYAPGGRYPLPSSVLMTAVTARVAGVGEVWVASPKPGPLVLAAAAVAGADAVLRAGGAQAIAALAYGAGSVPACDVVVGPGNRWVTAAKFLVSADVGIDMLAGPSEVLVLADSSADPALVAADLLAQAEHDAEALPVLVALDPALPGKVERELARKLADLPTAGTARAALANGFTVVVPGLDEAVRLCDLLAPEHLELMIAQPRRIAGRLRNYGALFLGSRSAEVFGDYGAGPNHVLPTGGSARFSSGLSVLAFLRARTWSSLRKADPQIVRDAACFARLEGLEAHARAAEARAVRSPTRAARRTAR